MRSQDGKLSRAGKLRHKSLIAGPVERAEIALAQAPQIQSLNGDGGLGANSQAVVVYVYLAQHARSETGRVNRSVKRIARDLGCSEPTIKRALRKLVVLNLIEREEQGRRVTTRTRLLDPRGR